MSFSILSSSANSPVVFYDGGERDKIPFELLLEGEKVALDVDPLAPECWNWRHYYSDAELNELWRILGLKFRFHVNREVLVDPTHEKQIFFHPFYVRNGEISVCYIYDEASYGHYIFWLVAVLWRPLPKPEYAARVENILKYWHKDG